MSIGDPACVRIRPIDPRDETWGVDDPDYRVYFWSRPPGPPEIPIDSVMWVCEEYEISGAPDVDAVLDWARATVGPDRLFTMYVVVKSGTDVGLVRLRGVDPTAND